MHRKGKRAIRNGNSRSDRGINIYLWFFGGGRAWGRRSDGLLFVRKKRISFGWLEPLMRTLPPVIRQLMRSSLRPCTDHFHSASQSSLGSHDPVDRHLESNLRPCIKYILSHVVTVPPLPPPTTPQSPHMTYIILDILLRILNTSESSRLTKFFFVPIIPLESTLA